MYSEALYEETRKVLEEVKGLDLINDFYLAGGTALALQLGHRKSIDLDFFTRNFPDQHSLRSKLSKFNTKVINQDSGTLDTIVDNVQVSFMEYDYPLLKDFVLYNDIQLASVLDIGCMKLAAISSRGTKKDYVDLYFITQKYPLKSLLQRFKTKFKGVDYSTVHLLKSLTYFDQADRDPDLEYLEDVKWDEVKFSIKRESIRLFNK